MNTPFVSTLLNTILAIKRHRVLHWFFLIVFGIGATLIYGTNYKNSPLDLDEYLFTSKSYYFDLFFISHDLQDPRWSVLGEPKQPKIGVYLYGLNMRLHGYTPIDDTLINHGYDVNSLVSPSWTQQYWQKKIEDIPSQYQKQLELILINRKVAVGFSIITLLLIYTLLSAAINMETGVITTFFLGFNRLFFYYSMTAMTDAFVNFAFVSNAALLWFIIKTFNKHILRFYFICLLLGLNATLALGVKVSGITVWLLILAVFLFLCFRYKNKLKSLFFGFIVAAMVFTISFSWLHPYTYPNPPKLILKMVTDRLSETHRYQVELPASALNTRFQAMTLIFLRCLWPYGNYNNFRIGIIPVDLLFFVIGFGLIIYRSFFIYKTKKIVGEVLIGLWFIVMFGSLVFYLRNDWPRYYLPLVVTITIIQAYAIASLIRHLYAASLYQYRPPIMK